jgi:hypothetical protein
MDDDIDLEDLDLDVKRSNELNEVFEKALQSFNNVQVTLTEERQKAMQDRRFCWVEGAQWEDFYTEQWTNKPRLEINTLQQAVTRIVNEYVDNKITAIFSPSDGSNSDEECDNLNSLYRAQSKVNGDEHRKNALIDAVTGGYGAWRLRAVYEDEYDEENDDQVVIFEPIVDADTSVFFDLNAKRQNKSDATEGWIITSMDAKEFEIEHKQTPASWPKRESQNYFDWYREQVVYIAEYYKVEETNLTIRFYTGLTGDEKKVSNDEFKDKDFISELEAMGYTLSRTKKQKTRKVHKYIMSGGGILEDCGYIAGKYIPIIPVYGKRVFIDNMERASGIIRICKDSARLKNVQASKLAEIASGSSVDKPIFLPEQVRGHEARWAEDAIKDYPYQLANAAYDINGQPFPLGPIGQLSAPQVPPALSALMQSTNDDLQQLLGNQQDGEILQANQSGIAVELVQNQKNMGNAGYMDNLAIAEEWSAKVWLEINKDILTRPGQKLKGENQGGKSEQIEIKKLVLDDNGKTKYINDFQNLRLMDVTVDIGPTSATKRAATEKGLMALLPSIQDPATQSILGNMILANSEGEGMSEIRPYFRQQLINQGAIEPTKEEKKKMQEEQSAQQSPPPDPQTEANTAFLNASAESEAAKSENLKAQTAKVQKEAEQVEANTQKIKADARVSELNAIQIAQTLDHNKAKIINDWLEANLPQPPEQDEQANEQIEQPQQPQPQQPQQPQQGE